MLALRLNFFVEDIESVDGDPSSFDALDLSLPMGGLLVVLGGLPVFRIHKG